MALSDKHHCLPAATLIDQARDARARTIALLDDLDDEQLEVPHISNVNPPRWELGHIAFFFEVFFLRELGRDPQLLRGADELFDSFHVAHDTRWSLPLPSREKTIAYMNDVFEAFAERLGSGEANPRETYLALLCTLHEDMHGEALTYTRQTLEYPAPRLRATAAAPGEEGDLPGDVEIPGGRHQLGASKDASFLFDNEKWGHPVEVQAFRIARAPVTNEAFAAFVDDGGYTEREFWSPEGWVIRSSTGAAHPNYWVRDERGWLRRNFDRYVHLEPHAPVCHVSWYEAEAYCRWARRRLPTEAEWDMAASAAVSGGYPWGDTEPSAELANLDSRHLGTVDVAAYPASDSAYGCRQMIGNVWEWTASAFYPFPGYLVDHPYREYSAPWFGYHKVLKGGAWATRSRLINNSYRNFFLPDRADVVAGFRTCAK